MAGVGLDVVYLLVDGFLEVVCVLEESVDLGLDVRFLAQRETAAFEREPFRPFPADLLPQIIQAPLHGVEEAVRVKVRFQESAAINRVVELTTVVVQRFEGRIHLLAQNALFRLVAIVGAPVVGGRD